MGICLDTCTTVAEQGLHPINIIACNIEGWGGGMALLLGEIDYNKINLLIY